MFPHLLRQHIKSNTAKSGFVLVTTLGILLTISLLGSWALRTSMSELRVAGSLLRYESRFNISEGAVNTEAAMVGFFLRPFYSLSDPSLSNWNSIMVPPGATPADELLFDPGKDVDPVYGGPGSVNVTDLTTWPIENLLKEYDVADTPEFDYRYLAAYLGYGNVMGSSAEYFSAYNFRVQGAAPSPSGLANEPTPLVIELGGTKLGPKATI